MSLAITTLDSCCPTKCVFIPCLLFWTTSRLCFILRRSLKYGGKESLTNDWDNVFSMANYQMVAPKFLKLLIVKETIFFVIATLILCSHLIEQFKMSKPRDSRELIFSTTLETSLDRPSLRPFTHLWYLLVCPHLSCLFFFAYQVWWVNLLFSPSFEQVLITCFDCFKPWNLTCFNYLKPQNPFHSTRAHEDPCRFTTKPTPTKPRNHMV